MDDDDTLAETGDRAGLLEVPPPLSAEPTPTEIARGRGPLDRPSTPGK